MTSSQQRKMHGEKRRQAAAAKPLTYCTNIHPGESWQEIFAAICRSAPVVKRKISPNSPFPLGLRLSGRAAWEMDERAAVEFHRWCRQEGLYVASVNGFPYGTFHHAPVKQEVYLPDWRQHERLHYTKRLAELLSIWLPEDMVGSISTVPAGFRADIREEDFASIRQNLVEVLDFLHRLAEQSGRDILLSMEPEPGCLLETMEDVIVFFDRLELTEPQRQRLAICYDCCHQALQFEDPVKSLDLLADNDIRIGHVQVSSALRLRDPRIALLERYQEECYLHQTVGRTADGSLLRYDDLHQAIAASPEGVEEWRVHFHVPVFLDETRECTSTRFFLEKVLPLLPAGPVFEVETYTWTILPPELQGGSVTDCLIRELEWVGKIIGNTK